MQVFISVRTTNNRWW